MRVYYPFLVGVDWLQIFCKMRKPIETLQTEKFNVVVSQFPTSQFKMKAEVWLKISEKLKIKFCEILFDPRLSVITVDSAQLRVMNECLYTMNYIATMREVANLLSLEYVSISRLDVFYDCNKFKGGVLPLNVVNKYVSQKILKIGINRGSINFQNYGYAIPIGTRRDAISVAVSKPAINAITWGQKDYIQTQLYNKSLELSQQKFKPYIWELWEKNALDPKNVWRLEFRISKAGKSLQLLEDGSFFQLGISEIQNSKVIQETICAYASKHFRFVKADYHRKKQQMKPLDLLCCFSDYQPTIKTKIAPAVSKSLKAIKSLDNSLEIISNAISEQDYKYDEIEYHIKCVRDYLNATFPISDGGRIGKVHRNNSNYSRYVAISSILEQIKDDMLSNRHEKIPSKWDEALVKIEKLQFKQQI